MVEIKFVQLIKGVYKFTKIQKRNLIELTIEGIKIVVKIRST